MRVCSGLALDALQVCRVTRGLSSAPNKAVGETPFSVPHLQGGTGHFRNKDRCDGVMPWCHGSFVKGLVNALASGCGEELADAAVVTECVLAKLAA